MGRGGREKENAARRNPDKRYLERVQRGLREACKEGTGPDWEPARRPGDPAPERVQRVPKGDARPFVGVDGEGAGTDALGRQLYMLLRAGDRELFTGRPLSTVECCDFLTSLPKGPIYVGFSIGYDITMMLRDMPSERLSRLLNERGLGRTTWTFFEGFAFSWLPKNHIMIGRTVRFRDETGIMREHVIKGSVRTFYEVFGFFQKSFLKVLHEFAIGTEDQRESIRVNKEARGGFAGDGLTDDMFCPFITENERHYCATECDFLAQLMEKFRDNCNAADIRPRTWNGAGKLSAALHKAHGTLTAEQVRSLEPLACGCATCLTDAPPLSAMTARAYFGGRFETTRHGPVTGPLHEYDIRSAYPAEMVKLPCLEHGTWERLTPRQLVALTDAPSRGDLPPDALFIAQVRFRHELANRPNLCGLPVRRRDGRIFWPVEGTGTYWSTELRAAAKLGCRVVYTAPGWVFRKGCDCVPFDWLEELYRYRQTLGASLMGYPIKLGINGTYGKLVQRVGNPKWENLIWGGLITAGTRAKLMDAASLNPEAIVMLATDGLFSRAPLALDLGDNLGQWEHDEHERLLIVQPGVYFGASRPKTRGVSPGFFYRLDPNGDPYTMGFERAWERFHLSQTAALGVAGIEWPSLKMPVRLFIGTKLAYARNRLDTAGRWVETDRTFSFNWTAKRGPALTWEGETGWSFPQAGSPRLVNYPHKGNPEAVQLSDLNQMELDDQPDWVDLSSRD